MDPKASFASRIRGALALAGPLRRALGLVWQADARGTIAMAALTLAGALLPVSQAWVAKLIIDSVTSSLSDGVPAADGLRAVAPYLYVELALFVASSLVTQLRALLEQILDHKLGFLINTRIIRKALRLELHYFENAEFYDKMQTARRESEYRAMAILNAVFLAAQNAITLASFVTLLFAFNPWLALVLFAAAIPAFVAQTRYGRLNFRLQTWKAPETRRMTYLEHLLTVDSSAKEIQLFGLGEPLLDRHKTLFDKVFAEDRALAWKRSWASLAWGLLATLSYYASYAWIVLQTIAGRIGLGSMTLYLAVFRQSQGTFIGLLENVSKLYENALFMENLFGFLDLPEVVDRKLETTVSPLDPARGLELEGVSFRYPGAKEWALREITLHIRPGEKLALVGENGSGKTTLIKLLTRLYEPTEGRILYQGRDLRDWPREELRRRIGVIFQDFVKYQLTLRENVGFGSVEDVEDQARLERAADQGGMDEVLASLEDGWATTLGGWFQKGRELSGGQWQRIALSRAFMREGEVIVLDEPTSALDAEKEYEIFKRFKELTAGRIAVLISHRFSTVRMADQIVVMHQGRVVESGSHPELLARAGTYARLFELQAQGYR